MTKLVELIGRLEKRAEEDKACAENSRVVADLLAPEVDKFDRRPDGAQWNTYAVRMAVDHRNSVKRDSLYATDLCEAVAALSAQALEIERLRAVIDFVARWAWRTDPPNATRKLSDADRLSIIRHHPTIRRAAQPHIDLAEDEARAKSEGGS
jgi:hypothetical protein